MDITSKIHPSELRHFIRHVCLAGKELKEKEQARANLHNQIKKIRKISLGKKSKKMAIGKEIEELNKKINIVVQKEGSRLKPETKDKRNDNYLKEQIKNLQQDLEITRQQRDEAITGNKEEIAGIVDSITQLKSKMHEVLKEKTERQDRIRELEKKVKRTVKA